MVGVTSLNVRVKFWRDDGLPEPAIMVCANVLVSQSKHSKNCYLLFFPPLLSNSTSFFSWAKLSTVRREGALGGRHRKREMGSRAIQIGHTASPVSHKSSYQSSCSRAVVVQIYLQKTHLMEHSSGIRISCLSMDGHWALTKMLARQSPPYGQHSVTHNYCWLQLTPLKRLVKVSFCKLNHRINQCPLQMSFLNTSSLLIFKKKSQSRNADSAYWHTRFPFHTLHIS